MIINWEPGIGDPTPVGWFTVAAYFFAAIFCFRAALKANVRSIDLATAARKEQYLWLAMAIILIFLGINKQLDLQSLFTDIGRHLAKTGGWYDERHVYQSLFINSLAIGAVFAGGLIFLFLRKAKASVKMALLGLGFLVTFVVARAASFHRADLFLGSEILGWRWNWVFELSGIGIIALSSIIYLRAEKADK